MQLSRQNLYRKALGLHVEPEVRRAGTFLYVRCVELRVTKDSQVELPGVHDWKLFGETFEKIASGYDMPTTLIINTTE